MTKGEVCVGVAGKSCQECYRLHLGCSNTSESAIYIWFLVVFINIADSVRKAKAEPSGTLGDPAKGKGRKAKAPTVPLTANSKAAAAPLRKKRGADEDEADSIGSSASCKKIKTDDLLSRAEAAELVGGVVMQLETVQQALDQVRASLAQFAGKANGKRRVSINHP